MPEPCCWQVCRHQTAVYQEKLSALYGEVLDTILLNSLLVLTTSEIATGVNHSGEPARHALPLGRREE
jgi:hypothetical protein